MSSDTVLRPAAVDELPAVAEALCSEDKAEIAALGKTPLEALIGSVASSTVSMFICIGGEVAAVFGVQRTGPRRGCLWLLTTEVVRRKPVAFYRAAKAATQALRDEFGELYNDLGIAANHEPALRLAKHLGFNLRAARLVEAPTGLHFFIPFTTREVTDVRV